MQRAPHKVLCVDKNAGRAEVISAYRRLAMRWHPDRNSSPDAKSRFQEIQRAYQILQSQSAFRDVRALWDEMTAQDGADYSQEIGGIWRDNFPFAAAAWLAAGLFAYWAAAYPGNWILLSLCLLAANGMYKTGITRRAFRAEATFRLAFRLYWLSLLTAAVYALGKKIISGT